MKKTIVSILCLMAILLSGATASAERLLGKIPKTTGMEKVYLGKMMLKSMNNFRFNINGNTFEGPKDFADYVDSIDIFELRSKEARDLLYDEMQSIFFHNPKTELLTEVNSDSEALWVYAVPNPKCEGYYSNLIIWNSITKKTQAVEQYIVSISGDFTPDIITQLFKNYQPSTKKKDKD